MILHTLGVQVWAMMVLGAFWEVDEQRSKSIAALACPGRRAPPGIKASSHRAEYYPGLPTPSLGILA